MIKKIVKLIFPLVIVISLYGIVIKSLINEYGLQKGIHCAALLWSFFVLCLPVARGKIIFGIPFYLITKKKLLIPELITWSIAIAINIFTYYFRPHIYFNTYLTHLFYSILSQPSLACVIIGVCAIATFYSSYVKTSYNKHARLLAELLIISSFITTFFLSYVEFIIVINTHGSI